MLKVKKETSIITYTTDNKVINSGDLVVLEQQGKVIVGRYNGFTKSGAINFTMAFEGINADFNIMPKSIDKIYLIEDLTKKNEEVEEKQTNIPPAYSPF